MHTAKRLLCSHPATLQTSQVTHCSAQVLLLLQSSDRIAHDICHAFDGRAGTAAAASAEASPATDGPQAGGPAAPWQRHGQQEAAAGQQEAAPAAGSTLDVRRPQQVLVLRAWREMRPGREFRCFVRGREIIGDHETPCVTCNLDLHGIWASELAAATFAIRNICGCILQVQPCNP